MKPIWIELVNKGVANRFELEDYEVVELNWRLAAYPDLWEKILEHEMDHQDGKYKAKDFMHDMKSRTPGLFKFMRNHISSWTQLLPFYWDRKKKTIVYDISAIVSWVMLFSTTWFIYKILCWFFGLW